MFNSMFVYTTLFSALFMTLMLKFMHLFSFIKWSPVGWAKKGALFANLHVTVQWGILFLSFVVLFALIYVCVSFLNSIPAAIPSLLISVFGVIFVEWVIGDKQSPMEVLRSISIPLLSITAIVLRFIVGTAVFHRELLRKV